MFQKFYPREYIDSTYSIDFETYYKAGFRGIIFDIDNTLVPHGADADERAIALLDRLRSIGFEICLLSNNKKARVERFNRDVNVKYIFKAGKPASKNYYVAAIMMRTSLESTMCVGDQIFTDIYGANTSGIYTILVKPIEKRDILQVKLKRKLEKIVLFFYKKRNRKSLKLESRATGLKPERRLTRMKAKKKLAALRERKRYKLGGSYERGRV
ncbi:MAG: YqeG family HAD IIIA-type phosphatase [Lachnospiraceae bacterium]|nr:YqeG family HAD IIIA-type phosphatase [Lachnospiraceae bacterium]